MISTNAMVLLACPFAPSLPRSLARLLAEEEGRTNIAIFACYNNIRATVLHYLLRFLLTFARPLSPEYAREYLSGWRDLCCVRGEGEMIVCLLIVK